jgi:hypothetical protein
MKKIIFTFLFLAILGGCSAEKTSTTESSSLGTDSSTSEATKSSTEEAEITDKTAVLIISSLEEGYSSFATVEREGTSNKFRLIPIEGVDETATLKKISSNPSGKGHQPALENIAKNLFQFTSTVEDSIGQPIKVSLADPNDNNKDMFVVSGDKIINSIYD